MKYKLIIDKQAQEEIIAIVHAPSSLTEQIENLVCTFSGADNLMGYRDDQMRKLQFGDIECITILDRKVIAIDNLGKQYRLRDRLRDLEEVLPSYFIRINQSYARCFAALDLVLQAGTAAIVVKAVFTLPYFKGFLQQAEAFANGAGTWVWTKVFARCVFTAAVNA